MCRTRRAYGNAYLQARTCSTPGGTDSQTESPAPKSAVKYVSAPVSSSPRGSGTHITTAQKSACAADARPSSRPRPTWPAESPTANEVSALERKKAPITSSVVRAPKRTVTARDHVA